MNLEMSNTRMILEVEVVEAANFKLCDSKRSSDPYCLLDCGEEYAPRRQTRVLYEQAGNCVWNDRFRMEPRGHSLRVSMFDKNRFSSDEPMGTVDILLTRFQDQKLHDEWFPLSGGGNIRLRVKQTDPTVPQIVVSQPVTYQYQQSTVSQPVTYQYQQPTVSQPTVSQPVTYQPQPVTYQPQPVTYQPQPVTYQPQPVTYQPQPVTYQPQPVTYQPQPVTYQPMCKRCGIRPCFYDPHRNLTYEFCSRSCAHNTSYQASYYPSSPY